MKLITEDLRWRPRRSILNLHKYCGCTPRELLWREKERGLIREALGMAPAPGRAQRLKALRALIKAKVTNETA